MNRLGNVVRAAVAAAVLVLPGAAAIAPAPDTTTTANPACCTGTPWGEIGEPPI